MNASLEEVLDCDYFQPINTGLISKVDTLSVSYKNKGVEFAFDENQRVQTIHMHSLNDEGFNEFAYSLPNDLSFSLSQQDVRSILGMPNKITSGLKVPVLGKMPDSDIYYFDGYSIAVVYSDNLKSIRRITLMTPEATPGKNKLPNG
jgi:hypothetical protein